MQSVISAQQMREIDRLTTEKHQVPSLQLMQNAAAGCFDSISQHFAESLEDKFARVLCGPGNNGGDGAALSILLSQAGVVVDVLLFGSVRSSKGDARFNFEKVAELAKAKAGPQSEFTFKEITSADEWKSLAMLLREANRHAPYDIIVDALFGTGLTRPLDGVFVQVVRHVNETRENRSVPSLPLIVSVDLPSGLNADLANPIGEAVNADLTVTFTAPKVANVLPPASHLNGKLTVANIGSPAALVEEANSKLFVVEEGDVRQWLINTRYAPGSFKNSHGEVLVIGGSRGFTSAAVLCGNAAMRSGAGLVTIATPVTTQPAVAASVMPEVMTKALAETDRGAVSDDAIDYAKRLAGKASVIAIGPGLSAEDERTRRFVFSVVEQRQTPVVIDADALNCLAQCSAKGWPRELRGTDDAPLILTPHPGEMLRLLGTTDKTVLDDRVAIARGFATQHKLILVLKGSRSLVAAPDGRVFINPTGNAGLGTAGSGDTLTGLIAGFMAQGIATLKERFDAVNATLAALYVGGLAGDFAAREVGMRSMVASDIRDHFSDAIRSLDPVGEQP